ncbi:unnamed protein product [Pylaiella littoralis]
MERSRNDKDPPAIPWADFRGKSPKLGQTPPSTLLYNPQPRPRFVVPQSSSGEQVSKRGPPLGGRGASGYWQFRTSKLSEQAPREVSQLFHGLSFYFNGRTGDKQTMHLKGAVSKYGGRTTPFMSMRGVTHVIAENLSAVKTHKAMKSLKMKVVHPDWLSRCIEEGKLLPDAPFRVVRSQKLGMDKFLGSSSSPPSSSSSSSSSSSAPDSSTCDRDDGRCRSAQKENETIGSPRRHLSSRRKVPAAPGARGERRHGEKILESRDRRGGAGGKRGRDGSGVASAAGAAPDKSSNGLEGSRRSKNGASNNRSVSRRTNSSTISCKRGASSSIKDGSHAGRNAPRLGGSMHDRVGLEAPESNARLYRPGHTKNITTPRKRCRDTGEILLPPSRTITASSSLVRGGEKRGSTIARKETVSSLPIDVTVLYSPSWTIKTHQTTAGSNNRVLSAGAQRLAGGEKRRRPAGGGGGKGPARFAPVTN